MAEEKGEQKGQLNKAFEIAKALKIDDFSALETDDSWF